MAGLTKKAAALMCAIILVCVCLTPALAGVGGGVEALVYPDAAVSEFSPELLDIPKSTSDYALNAGRGGTGIYRSPYFALEINGAQVPVYSTLAYCITDDAGVLESFAAVYVRDGAFPLSVSFGVKGVKLRRAVILPLSAGIDAAVSGGSVRADISGTGIYTLLLNDDDLAHACTLIVRERVDEDAEIAALRGRFGAEKVAVYEPGMYELDEIHIGSSQALYLKRGAYIKAKHVHDITSAEDEKGKPSSALFDLAGAQNAVIAGCGTADFTALDWHERVGVGISFCEDVEVSGLILIDCPSWSFTVYGTRRLAVSDIVVLGWRENNDGINICNSSEVTVSDCVCRNGDDCFSVKCTETALECRDVLFERCVGWSSKARCFGVTGEVNADIHDITFRDCSVVYRDAVWNNDRIGSLAVVVECGEGQVYDILFDNIEIYRDTGRPINCTIYGEDVTGCAVWGVVFKDVTVHRAGLRSQLCSQRGLDAFSLVCAAVYRVMSRIPALWARGWQAASFFSSRFDLTNSVVAAFDGVRVNGLPLSPVGRGLLLTLKGNCRALYL